MRQFNPIRTLVCWLALSIGLQAQQYVFHVYGQAEGLKNLAVNGLTTDRNGTLWAATENGVYRFLGSGFERFGADQGIAELDALDVVSDANGTVWVGTEGNLYYGRGQKFFPAGRQAIKVGRQGRLVIEDAHHLLVVDQGKLYRLEHDTEGRMISYLPVIPDSVVASIPELGNVRSVSVLREPLNGRRIWNGCGKRLFSLPSGQIETSLQAGERSVTAWGSDKGLPEDSWGTVLRDHEGTLWVAGLKHVMALPAGTDQFTDHSIPGSDPGNTFGHSPLIEDPDGRVLAPAKDGIARWERTGWRLIGRENGLQRISRISGMTFDAAGDLWLAGSGSGILHWLGYRDWEGWTDTQGLPSSMIWDLRPLPDRRVMVGTETGPAWIVPLTGSVGSLSASKPWTFGQLDAMGVNPDGSVWGGTFSGATLRIDSRSGTAVPTARLPSSIQNAFSDATGRVFFATIQGIYMRDSGDPSAIPHRVSAADTALGESSRVEAGCAASDGSAWFVASSRLIHFQGGQWSVPHIDGMPKLDGLLLAASCAPDGSVWVTGEEAGVWKVSAGSGGYQAGRLELPPELRSLAFLAILVDRRGWVWLGSDSGLAVWNGSSWRHLTQESGLIWNDIDQGVLLESADGALWIGTSGGVAHLLHPEHVFDPVPIEVSVTGIRRGSEVYTDTQEIKLPWSNLPLQFQISSTAMRNRSELVFKYRMEGLQPDWLQSQDGVAVFSGLPPGEYTFAALASNSGLDATSATINMRVTILPPWWRSKWFYALCVVAVLLLGLVVDRLRAQQLRERSRELGGMVRERTVELEKRRLELEERTQELEASREQLRIQAIQDGLTGLLNHVAILRAFAAEMERARRESRTLVLAMVDLDNFKGVNDVYGHLAGDEALRFFAKAVNAAIRTYDHAGRYGGEEFLLVLGEVPAADAQRRLSLLHALTSNIEVAVGEAKFIITCSIGAVVYNPTQGIESMESLLTTADQALYFAKESGRNRVVVRQAHRLETRQENFPKD